MHARSGLVGLNVVTGALDADFRESMRAEIKKLQTLQLIYS